MRQPAISPEQSSYRDYVGFCNRIGVKAAEFGIWRKTTHQLPDNHWIGNQDTARNAKVGSKRMKFEDQPHG